MKKLTILVIVFILAVSCNKIDTSKDIFDLIKPTQEDEYDPVYAASVIRKIYVEEFTGHHCTFCPDGMRILKNIMEADTTVIATAIHCSSLANPLSSIYANNYKTPMGDAIEGDFGILGLPKAMINRMPASESLWGFERSEWAAQIARVDRNNITAGIQLNCTVNNVLQEVEAKVSVSIIKDIPNPVRICLILQQDGIISGQLDAGVDIAEYEHNHMLRSGFNGNYGTLLTESGLVTEKTKYTTSFKLSYKTPFPYGTTVPVVIQNCSVVAYLIDMVTNEILQVEEVKLN